MDLVRKCFLQWRAGLAVHRKVVGRAEAVHNFKMAGTVGVCCWDSHIFAAHGAYLDIPSHFQAIVGQYGIFPTLLICGAWATTNLWAFQNARTYDATMKQIKTQIAGLDRLTEKLSESTTNEVASEYETMTPLFTSTPGSPATSGPATSGPATSGPARSAPTDATQRLTKHFLEEWTLDHSRGALENRYPFTDLSLIQADFKLPGPVSRVLLRD